MPHARFSRLPLDKRKQILRAAGREFAEHGYDGATMQRILSQADISTGAAYYYFDNKADLFATVVEYYTQQILVPMAPMARVIDAESFWKTFYAAIETALGQSYEDHKLLAALQRTWKVARELRQHPEIEQLFSRNESHLSGLVALGRKVGAIRTDLRADLLVRCVSALNEAADDWMSTMPTAKAKAEVTRAISAFRQFLEPVQPKTRTR